ncbi:MAG TPA: hypothetical protein VG275_10635 [Solirubrobacteraceae bacterium]|jgi:hypothetical protein|nr:hypothetical protein [Solirubrobacteraceae bacterium]
MHASRSHVGLGALLATALTILGAASVNAATTSKPYSLVIAPGTPSYENATGEVASGETVGITATFTNQTSTQQIGSANLFWPAGFDVVGSPSVTPSGTASVANSCAYLGSPGGPCVQLRSVAVPPGGTMTVTMSVTTPVGQAGSGHPWKAEVKQANNYSGSPGNDLSFNGGNLNTTLDGATSLAFGVEPADAQTNQAITGTAYTPSAPGLTVKVYASGQPVPTSTAPVTMGIGNNAGGGALGGTTTQPADGTDGTATFGNLTLSAPALAYTLAASSGTLTGTTSTPFDIQDQATACSPNLDCPVSDGTSNQNKSDIVATASTGAGELVESVFTNPAAQKALCGSYGSVDPNTYESAYTPAPSSADRGEIITTTFVPTKKLGGNVQQVLKAQQICFGDAKTFVTASGAPAMATTLPDGKAGFVGLLQTCSGSTVGPCHDRKSDTTVPDPASPTGYDIVLVADVPIGWADDPMHG